MGGKSNSSTAKVELPESLEQGAEEVLAAGLRTAALPYSPNRGVTIAAFSPQQEAAFQGANMGAGAFGLPTADMGGYLPEAERNAGGILGYSTGGMYDEMVNRSMTDREQLMRQSILNSYAGAAERISPDPFFAQSQQGVNQQSVNRVTGNNPTLGIGSGARVNPNAVNAAVQASRNPSAATAAAQPAASGPYTDTLYEGGKYNPANNPDQARYSFLRGGEYEATGAGGGNPGSSTQGGK